MSKNVDLKTLLEAGAHFGHKTSRWHPKMAPYIHSKRGGIHIIDLIQTSESLDKASEFVAGVAASGKKVLFVGTKKHIAPVIEAAAEAAGMPYVTQRWFGGMLTNFSTISERVKRLKQLEEQLQSGELSESYNKREVLEFTEERDKLAKDFAGISKMDKLPGALFISDVPGEKTAIREARRLKIPVVAIVDTNADPTLVDYVIPANDDAVKTVKLISDTLSAAVIQGAKDAATKPVPGEGSKDKPGSKKPIVKKPGGDEVKKTIAAAKKKEDE